MTNLLHHGVQGSAFIGLDAFAAENFCRRQCFATGLLGFDHGQRSVRRVLFIRLAQGQPTFDHCLRSVAVEDQKRSASGLGDLRRAFALCTLEVSGIDHYREARVQDHAGNFVQAAVGRCAGISAINTGLHVILNGLLAEQTFAFDV